MKNSIIYSFLARCGACLVIVCFMFAVTHYTPYNDAKKAGTTYQSHFDMVAIMPAEPAAYSVTVRPFIYPANDRKPVNTNYQLIRHSQLNLRQTELNI